MSQFEIAEILRNSGLLYSFVLITVQFFQVFVPRNCCYMKKFHRRHTAETRALNNTTEMSTFSVHQSLMQKTPSDLFPQYCGIVH